MWRTRPVVMFNETHYDVVVNNSDVTISARDGVPEAGLKWGVLALIILILASVLGNALVCIAVCWERRLQNMTNYFLMSLAIADLLVSLLVMPLAMIVELYGYFPFERFLCVIWATMDVLMCTASIWHMCTMSMDRFFTLKYPMKYGRNKTKAMVRLKIAFVWVVSIAVCSPVCIHGFMDYSNVYTPENKQCMPVIRNFIIYGSIFAFYVPLLTMIITYVLTIRILCNNQSRLKDLADDHFKKSRQRKERNGFNHFYRRIPHFSPKFRTPSPSALTNATVNTADCDVTPPGSHTSTTDAEKEALSQAIPIVMGPDDNASLCVPSLVSPRTTPSPSHCPSPCPSPHPFPRPSLKSPDIAFSSFQKLNALRPSNMSVSQPHLPSAATANRLQPFTNVHNPDRCPTLPKTCSYLSVHDLESVRNFKSLSRASLNSLPSDGGSSVWKEFEDPLMLGKLTKIEHEMDLCLVGKANTTLQHDDNDCNTTANEKNLCETSNTGYGAVHERKPLNIVDTIPPVTIMVPDNRDNANKSILNLDLACRPNAATSNQSSDCYTTTPGNDESISTLTPTDSDPSSKTHTIVSTQTSKLTKIDLAKLWRRRKETWLTKSGVKTVDQSTDESSVDGAVIMRNHVIAKRRRSSWQQRSLGRQVTTPSEQNSNDKSWWRSLSERQSGSQWRGQSNNGQTPRISKRKTINEKKASKVLGIIFAVFVVLWTPFFIMNVTTALCEQCASYFTPAIVAAIVWLGYLSSLANPIVYTMFNTAFRHTFYKILTCQYHCDSTKRRKKAAESIYLTSCTRQNSEPSRRQY